MTTFVIQTMIDLTQFRHIFFEESCEGLDLIESTLLDTQPETISVEAINTIFRAAHSLKGGSATFGFECMTGLTHTLETLLDEVRSGLKPITPAAIQVVLETVDCLRNIITTLQNGDIPNLDPAHALEIRIKTFTQAR